MEDLIDFNSPAKFPVKSNNVEIKVLSPESSFQILNESMLNMGPESVSFTGRPSVLLRDALDVLNEDCGRESLGILQISPNAKSDLLSTMMYDRKLSNFSSLSSIDSLELSKPSKIYSLESQFNNAFISNFSETFVSDIPSILNQKFVEAKDLKLRMHSMPNVVYTKSSIEKNKKEKAKSAVIDRKSSSDGSCYSLGPDDFNDSVFIEAHHIASKIADGSILENSFEECNVLDCTPQPDWDDISDIEDKKEIKQDPESLLKTLDKLIPMIKLTDNNETKSPIYDCKSSISEIIQENCNISKTSVASNKSKNDHKEMIQNLSDILHSGVMDSEQKKAGQHLLADIANILNSKRSSCVSSDDSGHSSIEAEYGGQQSEDHKCYEILDLSNKASTSEHHIKPLDLSLKKSENMKRLTQSFSFSSPKMPPSKLSNNLKDQAATLKNIVSSLEGTRYNISDSRLSSASSSGNLSNVSTKMKPKKNAEKSKNGPLKAVIPMSNVLKSIDTDSRKSATYATGLTTPTRQPQSAYKRTSTPIDSKYNKPVAQSTPTENKLLKKNSKLATCSTELKKRKLTCPISPLTHNLSSLGEISGKTFNKSTSSNSNISNNSSKSISRRHSSTDVKNLDNSRLSLRRSYSVGKENALSSWRKSAKLPEKVDENLEPNKNVSLPTKSSYLKKSNIKPFSLVSKLDDKKKVGKKLK